MQWVKQTGYQNSRIARSGLFAAGMFAALLMACGNSNSPGNSSSPADTTSNAGFTVQATATSTSAAKSASPNPSSTTEIVFAPDFELPQAGGGTVRLSDIYSRANTVLVFYRGYF
ncbi:MAG TPA: redoxin domain-containing protein [Dehalococcoidia bacterium]|nr:redoxin domain-containing protein [Dehalococcoidia bacterium]